MSVDKLVDSTQLDSDLTSVANAIRTKGGTSASLAFPAEFVSAIAAIPSGGSYQEKTGTISLAEDAQSVTFSCSFQPDVVYVYTDDLTAQTERHVTNYYFHAGFCGFVRGQAANSTSISNFAAGLSLTAYSIGTIFGSHYKVDYAGGIVTVQSRSGYGFLSAVPYSFIAIKYT